MHRIIRRTRIQKRKNTSKRRTSRKIHRKRYSRKRGLKGGNFGGHCPDPFNYSVYNSNMLKLFPYRP